jgi:hypothetical protein
VAAPILVKKFAAGDQQEDDRDVVAEVFAGEQVIELAGVEVPGLLALLLAVLAGLRKTSSWVRVQATEAMGMASTKNQTICWAMDIAFSMRGRRNGFGGWGRSRNAARETSAPRQGHC